jgi:GT2 family glycosyltransferase
MRNVSSLTVSIPKFDDRRYLEANPIAAEAIRSGTADDAIDHFIRFGIDENRYQLIRREPLTLACSVERFLVSESGFCLLLGWLADEGYASSQLRLLGNNFNIELSSRNIFRNARADVEQAVKPGAYDYGFLAFGRAPSRSILKQSLTFQVSATAGSFQCKVTPEIVSDKRLLDTILQIVATSEAHAGKESALASFLSGPAGNALVELFQLNVNQAVANPYIERFRPRPVTHTFVTVLFGSTEPVKLQPLLFRAAKLDFGEWIYVCNSPEDANLVLCLAKQMSELYDVMITVIVLGDNAGFGAANNIAIKHASSDRIFIINPDVYPLPSHASLLQEVLSESDLGSTLWGGLLFYDEHNLMHSGMYVTADTFVRRNSLNNLGDGSVAASAIRLLRVEHYDKGVPFQADKWKCSKDVPAITGAVMAFERPQFERLGGFSTRYIYGHYEDADLSLRWWNSVGVVALQPHIRLVHLEGQGSKARGEEFRGASIVNRYFFSSQHGDYFDQHLPQLSKPATLVA